LSTAEIWTNTSAPPPSGLIKPYPLVELNHFTIPIATSISPPGTSERNERDSSVDLAASPRQKTVVERSHHRPSATIVNDPFDRLASASVPVWARRCIIRIVSRNGLSGAAAVTNQTSQQPDQSPAALTVTQVRAAVAQPVAFEGTRRTTWRTWRGYLILAKHSFRRSSSRRTCDSMASCRAAVPLLENSGEAFLSRFCFQSRIACLVAF